MDDQTDGPIETITDGDGDSRTAMIVGLVAAGGAMWLARKLMDLLWKRFFGHGVPKADDEDGVPFLEIVAAAAVSGALVGILRASATRGARKLVH